MACAHNTLKNYYEMNFSLMQYHKWSLSEVEGLIPWERELYVNMLLAYLEKKKEEAAAARQ
jgi:hypothetical protein